MFGNRQIAVIEGKCRRFRNSFECSNTYCAANNRPIWTQKVPKKSVKMWTTIFYKTFFKNILLYMNGRLSKTRAVHTYVMPRTVYFDWICMKCGTVDVQYCERCATIGYTNWQTIHLMFFNYVQFFAVLLP